MKDEIKEILDNLIRYRYSDAKCKQPEDVLTTEDMWILLDYITNLQENYERIYNENCILREKHNITDISLLDENNNLQQENERLREANERLKEELNKKPAILTYDYTSDVYEELENYKSRNERLRKELENISLDEANIRADILLEQEGSE